MTNQTWHHVFGKDPERRAEKEGGERAVLDGILGQLGHGAVRQLLHGPKRQRRKAPGSRGRTTRDLGGIGPRVELGHTLRREECLHIGQVHSGERLPELMQVLDRLFGSLRLLLLPICGGSRGDPCRELTSQIGASRRQ